MAGHMGDPHGHATCAHAQPAMAWAAWAHGAEPWAHGACMHHGGGGAGWVPVAVSVSDGLQDRSVVWVCLGEVVSVAGWLVH